MIASPQSLDPRVRKTRRRLQEGLLTLMATEPFQAITVKEITNRADVNRGTFYLHYTDKFDLLAGVGRDYYIEEMIELLPNGQLTRAADIKRLTVATCNFLDRFVAGCSPLNKPFEPLIEAEIQKLLFITLKDWLDNQPAPPQGSDITATIISWAILGAALTWNRSNRETTPEQTAQQVYTVLSTGISGLPA